MADGFFALGDLLAGGQGPRNDAAFLEGSNVGSQINLRKSQTENALAQARQRRQEAEANMQLGDALESAGLDPALAPILQSGRGSDFSAMTTGIGNTQEQGFRETIADPALGVDARQAAAQAVSGKPLGAGDFLGPGGELFVDVFNPSAATTQPTQTGQAQIGADVALAGERDANAALRDEKRLHPDRFKNTTNLTVNTPLADAILPGGLGTSIVPGNIDAEEGFGAEAVAKNAINGLVDFFGGGAPFPDTNVANNVLSELSARTQIAMRADVPGGRPPVMVQELLARYAEDPAQLFRGDDIARQNLQTTFDSLSRSQQRIADQLNSPTKKTPTRQGTLEQAYLNLSDTIADYKAILDNLDAKYGPLTGTAPANAATPADEGGWQTLPDGTRYRVKQ